MKEGLYHQLMREHSKKLLTAALEEHRTASAAARALGINRTWFHKLCATHGVKAPVTGAEAKRRSRAAARTALLGKWGGPSASA